MLIRRYGMCRHGRWCSTSTTVQDMPKSYDDKLVQLTTDVNSWLQQQPQTSTTLSMLFPPPNVTGSLHLGHALTATIQDAMCRWHAQRGAKVCWIPGFDHAGIATQVQVEKKLWKERRQTRHDMKRGEFFDECMKWKDSRVTEISAQLGRLGVALDWSKQYYTMDENFQRAVSTAFHSLHSQNLIFRDNRLVNWCPQLRSTISDQEVTMVSVSGSQPYTLGDGTQVTGHMYHVDYAIVDKNSYVTVATTRPETILADVALAVHPDDARYSSLIGCRVLNPVLPDVSLPVVGDDRVDRQLGTGVLKITPAHDVTDYEIGEQHDLPLDRACLGEDGVVLNAHGQYSGMHRFQARQSILADLQSSGRLRAVVDHEMMLPTCSRSGDVIEPMIKDQWFMRTSTIADELLRVVKEKELQLRPEFYEKHWMHWIESGRDWCLSRQLLWGHRVPAWLTKDGRWLSGLSESSVRQEHDLPEGNLCQDPDVLDTWFSSSLVPLVVAGWPDSDRLDGGTFPLSVMETGHDILGFWVNRMVMMLTGRLPFNDVLLHGLIVDGRGKKMSKSTGNVIDPLDVIDGISQDRMVERVQAASGLDDQQKSKSVAQLSHDYPDGISSMGTDALRFGLLRHDPLSPLVSFDVNQIRMAYKFCNKIWQAISYCQTVWSKAGTTHLIELDRIPLTPTDTWILARCAQVQSQMEQSMINRQFAVATTLLHEFWLLSFCDVYLETTKSAVWADNSERVGVVAQVLAHVAQCFVLHLSPFMPYLCQYLHTRLPFITNNANYSLFTATPPDLSAYASDTVISNMTTMLSIVNRVRGIRIELGVKRSLQLNTIASCTQSMQSVVDEMGRDVLTSLAAINISGFVPPHATVDTRYLPVDVADNLTVWLDLPRAERDAILTKVNGQIRTRQTKLDEMLKTLEVLRNKPTNNEQKARHTERTIQRIESKTKSLRTQIEALTRQTDLLK